LNLSRGNVHLIVATGCIASFSFRGKDNDGHLRKIMDAELFLSGGEQLLQ
jgi:hypothetical protein